MPPVLVFPSESVSSNSLNVDFSSVWTHETVKKREEKSSIVPMIPFFIIQNVFFVNAKVRKSPL